MRTVFAFTESVPAMYPGYVNLRPNAGDDGGYVLTARPRGGAEPVAVDLPRDAALGLYHALAQAIDGKIG